MRFSGMSTPHQIVDLRNLLAARFPQAPMTPGKQLSTGLAALDQVTGGGLPQSALVELTSPLPQAGSAWLIYALLRAAQRGRYFLALIDGRDSFDPTPLAPALLRHLLWIRCRHGLEAIKAADLLLRDGNFPLLILDLVLNPPGEKIPQTTWYRLQRLAEPVPTAFLILTRRSMVSSAQFKLMLENSHCLPDLERTATTPCLQFHLQRAHGGRQAMGGG
jgi:hypothetical protein